MSNYWYLKMVILEFYIDEVRRNLYVEFSLIEEENGFYRIIELSFRDVKFYSPTIVSENDLSEIDDDFIKELLIEYFKENNLPEERSL